MRGRISRASEPSAGTIAAVTRLSSAAWKSTEIGARLPEAPALEKSERPVRQADLDAEVIRPSVERGQVRLQGRNAIRRDVRGEIGRREVGVREAADRGRVAPDDRLERGRGEAARHDHRLAERRDADDHQERAEDEDEQDGPRETGLCARNGRTPSRTETNPSLGDLRGTAYRPEVRAIGEPDVGPPRSTASRPWYKAGTPWAWRPVGSGHERELGWRSAAHGPD